VSQFTLYGFLKGNKPDFHVAMAPQRAKPFYASLVDRFRNAYNSDAIKVLDKSRASAGYLGNCTKKQRHVVCKYALWPHTRAHEQVNLVNDGPVTMQLDSQSPKNTVDAAKS
ncbi:D-tyrosyl-tRNA(Tyr) deacylase, partial [Trifolium pratense]